MLISFQVHLSGPTGLASAAAIAPPTLMRDRGAALAGNLDDAGERAAWFAGDVVPEVTGDEGGDDFVDWLGAPFWGVIFVAFPPGAPLVLGVTLGRRHPA